MKEKHQLFSARAFKIVALALFAMFVLVCGAGAAEVEPLKMNPLSHRPHQLDTNSVHWRTIVGVISAPNKVNPVGNIQSGTFPWSVHSGQAQVNLSTGQISFQFKGLVINGQIFSGTPGPVSAVTGTLVCNPGDASQAVFDTPAVPLDQSGGGHFAGQLANVPGICSNPLFLIRIAVPEGAAGLWIATGAERVVAN